MQQKRSLVNNRRASAHGGVPISCIRHRPPRHMWGAWGLYRERRHGIWAGYLDHPISTPSCLHSKAIVTFASKVLPYLDVPDGEKGAGYWHHSVCRFDSLGSA